LFFGATTALKVFAPALSFTEDITRSSQPLTLKKLFFGATTALKVFAPALSFTEDIARSSQPLTLKKLFFGATTALKVFAPALSFTALKPVQGGAALVLKKLFFPTSTALKVFAPKLSFSKKAAAVGRALVLKRLFFTTNVALKVFAPRLTLGHVKEIIDTNERIATAWKHKVCKGALNSRKAGMRKLKVQTVHTDLIYPDINYNGTREDFEFFNVAENPKIYRVKAGVDSIAPPRRYVRSALD
jgi:hypothetical protein